VSNSKDKGLKRRVTLVLTRTVVTTELCEVELADGEPLPVFPDGSPTLVVPVNDSRTSGPVFLGSVIEWISRGHTVPRLPMGSTPEQEDLP
jgi:hypothetical protein